MTQTAMKTRNLQSRPIKEFLRRINCEQYCEVFKEHGIVNESDLLTLDLKQQFVEDLPLEVRGKLKMKIKDIKMKQRKRSSEEKEQKPRTRTTSSEMSVRIGGTLKVGENASFAVDRMETGGDTDDNSFFEEELSTNTTTTIKAHATNAEIRGVAVVKDAKICDPARTHSRKNSSSSKNKKPYERQNSLRSVQNNNNNSNRVRTSQSRTNQQEESHMDVTFESVHLAPGAIIGVEKYEKNGDPENH